MSASDEMVSQFMAFTGSADAERASMYLEMSGGNLETAVGLFMEHQGGGGGGGSSSPGFGGASSMGAGDDNIRAPDATQTMRLMDDTPHAGLLRNPYMPMGMLDPMIQQQLATSAFARDVVNAAAEDDDDDDHMDEGDDDDSNYNEGGDDENVESGGQRRTSSRTTSGGSSRGTQGLADMFAPPRHLICNAGGFDGARASAKDSKRWLLVNIQRDNEFSCHALNRDVWRDELVENLIGEGFVFWQEMDAHPDGAKYAQRYNVYDYPHVAIIDPRTGRSMWKKEGWTQQNPLTAEQFAEMAMDFCSRHSFDKPPQAPRPPGSGNGPKSVPAKRSVHEMSEEEQLQAAMRASMEDSGAAAEYEYEMDSDDDDVEIVDASGANVENDSKPKAVEKNEVAAAPAPAPQAPASMLDELVDFDIGDEPDKGARIQFRMPDGKRKIRKFDASNTVRHVYAFVAQSNPEGKNGKEFVLKAGFPPKDLIGDIDNSIQAASLSGEAITVRWK